MHKGIGLAIVFILVGIILALKDKSYAGEFEVKEEPKKEPVKVEYVYKTKEEPKIEYVIDVTKEDMELMARVVMSEASILHMDAKQAVAQVIVNRVLDDEFPDTVREVIEEPYQFSTQDNGRPDMECYLAVEGALLYEAFPRDMLWFRTDRPHEWGYEYAHIGNTYFTTRKDYNDGHQQIS